MPRDTVTEIAFKVANTRNVVARTTFAQSGHFTELDNGHDFYAPPKLLAKGWSALLSAGWICGIANALKT